MEITKPVLWRSNTLYIYLSHRQVGGYPNARAKMQGGFFLKFFKTIERRIRKFWVQGLIGVVVVVVVVVGKSIGIGIPFSKGFFSLNVTPPSHVSGTFAERSCSEASTTSLLLITIVIK